MDDNKKFWSKCAKIYEKCTRGGRNADLVYSTIEDNICTELNADMRVIELAAGPGIMSSKIAAVCGKLEVTDFSEEMLNIAKKKNMPDNVTFAVADATNLKYNNESFDAVIIANALHIMPDPDKALKEIKRVLKKDGILIAPTFTREKSVRSIVAEKVMSLFGFKTFSKWTSESFVKYMTDSGFKILRKKIITGHNFPVTFLVCNKVNGYRKTSFSFLNGRNNVYK